jgi:hypothetical protein
LGLDRVAQEKGGGFGANGCESQLSFELLEQPVCGTRNNTRSGGCRR